MVFLALDRFRFLFDFFFVSRYNDRVKRKLTKRALIIDLYQSPKYRGKHIIVVGGRVYAAKTGKAKTRLLDRLLEKYPEETPTIAYIPKVDSLILLYYL